MAKFTDISGLNFNKTLARQLVPTADSLRDLFTQFGLRPYKVRVVRTQWTGGRRGIGAEVVKSAMDILPTPLVTDLTTLTEVVNPVGLDEIGAILLQEVSGRFTDEELRGLTPDGREPGPDEQVYYEIEFPRPDGRPGDKRRFAIRSAPMYFSGRLQWQVRLEKSHEDRARNGDTR